jgi:predicted MFS family arabinose efflux permease
VLIILGLIKLFFVVVGGRLFDQSGRRPLIFTSLLGCAGSLLAISLCFLIDSSLSASIIVICLGVYLAFFSIGMGMWNVRNSLNRLDQYEFLTLLFARYQDLLGG